MEGTEYLQKAELHEVRKEKDYRMLDKMSFFAVSFLERSTRHTKTDSIMKALTRYGEIVFEVTRDVWPQLWSGKELLA